MGKIWLLCQIGLLNGTPKYDPPPSFKGLERYMELCHSSENQCFMLEFEALENHHGGKIVKKRHYWPIKICYLSR
jgi:hypothetical protein